MTRIQPRSAYARTVRLWHNPTRSVSRQYMGQAEWDEGLSRFIIFDWDLDGSRHARYIVWHDGRQWKEEPYDERHRRQLAWGGAPVSRGDFDASRYSTRNRA